MATAKEVPAGSFEAVERMTLSQVKDALVLKVLGSTNQLTEAQLELAKEKASWVERFMPLVDYHINHHQEHTNIPKDTKSDGKISSTELSLLWDFFREGLHLRHIMSTVDMDAMKQLCNLKNPFAELTDKLVKDDIVTAARTGTFIYQSAYNLFMLKWRMCNAFSRYESIYDHSDDPIEWYKRNNGHMFTVEGNANMIQLMRLSYWIEDKRFDPVAQM